MRRRYTWDEAKRKGNLAKHGLDFSRALEILESRFRFDVPSLRAGEARTLSMSYVPELLAVLTVVHTERDGTTRIISLRRASQEEREVYRDWLENECDEP